MKKVTKLLALFLATLSILLLFAACKTKTSDPVDETSKKESENLFDDNLPKANMNGFEFRLLTYNSDWFTWALTTMDAEYGSGDIIDDAIAKRNAAVEERFNCELKITAQKTINGNEIDRLVAAGGGSDAYQVVMFYDKWVASRISAFANWNNVPYLDLTRNGWYADASNVFNIGGKRIALKGNFDLSTLSTTSCMAFNKDLYTQKKDLSTIYDLVKNEEWDLDAYYSLAKDYLSEPQNGENPDTGIYGTVGGKKSYYTSLLEGCGLKFVKQDENGYPIYNISTAEVDIIDKVLQLHKDNNAYYDTASDVNHEGPGNMFETGHALFRESNMYGISKLRSNDDLTFEFGIVPFPKYTETQADYVSRSAGACSACLFKSTDPDDYLGIGIILEAMTSYSQKNIVPVYKNLLLKTRSASDDESANSVDLIFNSVSFDFGVTVWEDYTNRKLVESVFKEKVDEIASTLEDIKNGISGQTEILKEQLKKMS